MGSPEALFWFLDELLPQEFLLRYNRYVKAYNLALERRHGSDPTERLLQKTLAKLQHIAGLNAQANASLASSADGVTNPF